MSGGLHIKQNDVIEIGIQELGRKSIKYELEALKAGPAFGLWHVRGVRPNRAADFTGAAILDPKNSV